MTWWRQHTSSSDGNPPPWGAWWKRSPCSFFSLGLAHHICHCSVCFFASLLFQALEMLLIHSILCPLSSLSISELFPFKIVFSVSIFSAFTIFPALIACVLYLRLLLSSILMSKFLYLVFSLSLQQQIPSILLLLLQTGIAPTWLGVGEIIDC